MTATAMFVTILAMGLVTYAIRIAPIELFSRIEMPAWALQAMRYVPIAVLTAIIVPELLRPTGALNISLGNFRLLAGILATIVAWRTKNVFWTVSAGMVVLWVLQFAFGQM